MINSLNVFYSQVNHLWRKTNKVLAFKVNVCRYLSHARTHTHSVSYERWWNYKSWKVFDVEMILQSWQWLGLTWRIVGNRRMFVRCPALTVWTQHLTGHPVFSHHLVWISFTSLSDTLLSALMSFLMFVFKRTLWTHRVTTWSTRSLSPAAGFGRATSQPSTPSLSAGVSHVNLSTANTWLMYWCLFCLL